MIVTFVSKCIRSHGLALLDLSISTDTQIIAWGSMSNQNCCKRFCCKEKVEKHWHTAIRTNI